MTWRYVLALLLIALLSTGAWVSMKLAIDASESTAALVNVGGRQRMLSQRTAMLAHELLSQPLTAGPMLQEAVDLMAQSHQALMQGNADLRLPSHMSLEVRSLYLGPTGALDAEVGQYVALVRQWLALPAAQRQAGHPVLTALTVAAKGDLLVHLDRMVALYQREGEEAVGALRQAATLLWGLTMLLLVLEALLIFRPTLRHTKETIQHLLASQADLQLYQVELERIIAARTADLALQLHAMRQRESALDCIDQGILIADADRCLRFANKGFERLTGYAAQDVLGRTCSFMQGHATDTEVTQAIREALRKRQTYRGEVLNYRKNGEPFWNDLTIHPLLDADQQLLGFVGVQHDVTALKFREQSYRDQAHRDPLTGLPNRQLLRESWAHALDRVRRTHRWGALLYIDLDHFKQLNDLHGHEYGDLLLIEASRRLRTALRDADTVARMGGDEFVVLVDDLDPSNGQAHAQATALADKLNTLLGEPYRLAVGHETLAPLDWSLTSASVGWSLFDGQEEDLEEVLHRADQSMYRTKRANR